MIDYLYKNITSDEYLKKSEQFAKWKITFMNQRRYLRDKTNMQEEYYYNEITGEVLDMKQMRIMTNFFNKHYISILLTSLGITWIALHIII
jgi:hypothetical protein